MALAPERLDLLYVAVRDGMEDEVELPVRKGKRLRHVASNDLDLIPLALGDHPLGFQLAGCVIEHSAPRTECSEDGHLLASAAGEPQYAQAG